MWRLTVRSPESEPTDIDLTPGVNTLGRLSSNNIVIQDISASRRHAEITLDPMTDTVTIRDLESTNGTFVNRQRITTPTRLQSNDVVRIGQVTLNLIRMGTGPSGMRTLAGTHRFDRDFLLESLDQHAMLLYEVSRRLNTVVDVESALNEVASLIRRFMGVQGCRVILAQQFDKLTELGMGESPARQAIVEKSAEVVVDLSVHTTGDIELTSGPGRVRGAMFVPVISGDEVLALLYIYRSGLNIRPFDQRDLQLAVAISHQAALVLQRMTLLERVRQEQVIERLLRRFIGPQEAKYMLQDYLAKGQLPGLTERKVTVLFSDIADSTGLAEKLGTKRFAELLNKFYQDAADIVFKYGGTIRYLGDGVMAVFVEHEGRATPEVDAVTAGVELIFRGKTTGHLDTENRVIMGVSINTGKAMMGYVGNQERAEFTVLGDTVNVAYRMQEYARPYRVVVGPATMAAIVGMFQTQRIGEISLRGREKPIQTYEVLFRGLSTTEQQ
jgi:adenylate cyclase